MVQQWSHIAPACHIITHHVRALQHLQKSWSLELECKHGVSCCLGRNKQPLGFSVYGHLCLCRLFCFHFISDCLSKLVSKSRVALACWRQAHAFVAPRLPFAQRSSESCKQAACCVPAIQGCPLAVPSAHSNLHQAGMRIALLH